MISGATTTITTDGSGDATVYIGSKLRGRIHAIKYEPGTIDAGADLTISGATSGVPILTQANAGTADVWYHPRVMPNKSTDGSLFTNWGAEIELLKEQAKVVVAAGGATKTGAITIYVDSPPP